MYQMISEKVSKLELIENFGALTMKKVLHDHPPSITSLEKQHGISGVKQSIAIIVADLNQSFGGDLAKDDILEIVAEICVGMTRNISLEDLYVICHKIKLSNYKLKVPVVLKAVNDYLNEKMNMAANENYNKHLATKFKADRSNTRDNQEENDFRKFKIEYLTNKIK